MFDKAKAILESIEDDFPQTREEIINDKISIEIMDEASREVSEDD